MHHSKYRGDDGLRGTGCYGNFGIGVVAFAMQGLHFVGNSLAQLRHTGHGWVLVVPGVHGIGNRFDKRWVAIKIWKALP